MKLFVRSILFSGMVAVVATSSMVAQTSNGGFEARYRAKYGRPAPTEQAHPNSAQANSAVQQAAALPATEIAIGGFEQRYAAKYGRPSTTDQARTNQAQQSENLSENQLNTLIATAKTAADHERIARIYESQADRYLALANEHAAMLAAYRPNSGLTNDKNQAGTINHCAHFVAEFNSMAAKCHELARSHERMAEVAAKM